MDYYIFEQEIIFILIKGWKVQNRNFRKQSTVIKAVKETLTAQWTPKTMLKLQIHILFFRKVSHVYLKSSNF